MRTNEENRIEFVHLSVFLRLNNLRDVIFTNFFFFFFDPSIMVSLTFWNNLDNSIICMTEKCSLNTYNELNTNAFVCWKKKMPNADIKEKVIEFQHKIHFRVSVQNGFDLLSRTSCEKAFIVVMSLLLLLLLSIPSHSNCYRSKWTEIYIGLLLFGRNYFDMLLLYVYV